MLKTNDAPCVTASSLGFKNQREHGRRRTTLLYWLSHSVKPVKQNLMDTRSACQIVALATRASRTIFLIALALMSLPSRVMATGTGQSLLLFGVE